MNARIVISINRLHSSNPKTYVIDSLIYKTCVYYNTTVSKVTFRCYENLNKGQSMEFEMRCNSFYEAVKIGEDYLALTILQGLDVESIYQLFKKTPLHMLAACGNKTVTKHLIKSGCKVDAKEIDGNTPLLLAIFFEHHEVAKLLVDAGADLFITNTYGRSPVFYAGAVANREISKMLKVVLSLDRAKRSKGMTQLMDATYPGVRLRRWMPHYTVEEFAVYDLVVAAFLEDAGQARLNFMYGPQRLGQLLLLALENRIGCHGCFLLRQLALLKVENVHMDSCFIEEVQKFPGGQLYYEECKAELQDMMGTTLFDNVTLFSILSSDKSRLELYAKNLRLVDAFKSAVGRKNLPHFKYLLEGFGKLVEQAELLRTARLLLGWSLPHFDHLVICKIVDCLETSDLKKLSECHRNVK